VTRSVNDPLKEYGRWSYRAGTSGTVVVSSGLRVVGITAVSAAGGSLTINSGDAIPVPAGTPLSINPMGNLVAPTIIFDSTNAYFVDTVDDSD
jgi:hypothetical protein